MPGLNIGARDPRSPMSSLRVHAARVYPEVPNQWGPPSPAVSTVEYMSTYRVRLYSLALIANR